MYKKINDMSKRNDIKKKAESKLMEIAIKSQGKIYLNALKALILTFIFYKK